MTRLSEFRSSLTGRLLFSLIVPAAICVGLLCFSGALTIHSIIERSQDRVLNAVGRSIIDTFVDQEAAKDGAVKSNLHSSALSLLDSGKNGRVYFSVRVGTRIVSGDSGLPIVDFSAPGQENTRFIYANHQGQRVRIVALTRPMPGTSRPVVVEIAQTLEFRRAAQWRMTMTLVFNGFLVICTLALLLPFSVRWGLAPLAEVEREIEGRVADDIRPLMLRNIPIEMRSILTAFNGLLLRLHDTMEEIRHFTSNASHQMRTPLSILRAHLDVIRREGLDSAKGQASFADVETAVSRLQRLLTQLLALARAEDAKEEVAGLFEQVDLVAVARDVAEGNVPVALDAGVELEFDARKAAIHVNTVETLAHELIANLMDNAIRYNRKGGSVRVILDQSDGSGSIVIEDDGPGIPKEEQTHIFERFRRLVRDRKHEGSGLGLAIVKTLADLIGATVTISQGANGTGVRAEVRFAAASPQA